MRIEDFLPLVEDVRPALLYHATDHYAATQILADNMIAARTGHLNRSIIGFRQKDVVKNTAKGFGWVNKESVNGVSFTRDRRFAWKWKVGGVVFVLDGNALRQRHRIVNISYYGTRTEAEEFVIGPVRNLDRYLVAIEISKEAFEEMDYHHRVYDSDEYAPLMNHPLRKIV